MTKNVLGKIKLSYRIVIIRLGPDVALGSGVRIKIGRRLSRN